jgi:hypothetical protein
MTHGAPSDSFNARKLSVCRDSISSNRWFAFVPKLHRLTTF